MNISCCPSFTIIKWNNSGKLFRSLSAQPSARGGHKESRRDPPALSGLTLVRLPDTPAGMRGDWWACRETGRRSCKELEVTKEDDGKRDGRRRRNDEAGLEFRLRKRTNGRADRRKERQKCSGWCGEVGLKRKKDHQEETKMLKRAGLKVNVEC